MRRANVVFITLLCWYIIITFRLFYFQVIAYEDYEHEAAIQYEQERYIPSTRGEIFDQHKNPLVLNADTYKVFVNPTEIENINIFSRSISSILNISESTLSSELLVPGRLWYQLKRKISKDIKTTLEHLDIQGIGFEKDPSRTYPEASMAAQLLGFVGFDEHGIDTGYFGIEGYYNRELVGKRGILRSENDSMGLPILIGERGTVDPIDGLDLQLWVDRSVQYIVEKHLEDAITRYGAKSGNVVIMNPQTGGILAMASWPSYDPSNLNSSSNEQFKNPVVAQSYEPGSTFKVLVMASGIEEKVISPESTMEETGPLEIGPYYIRTWNNKYYGTVTMQDILTHSSNVGMVYVAKTLGTDRMIRYIKAFGFGEKTNIDLEDEESPQLRPDNNWKEIDYATASFGQGIAVTPIQMVRAVSVIANGGWLIEPHVVDKIITDNGIIREIPTKRIKRVISEDTAKQVAMMMVRAVQDGESKRMRVKGYQIAGKTGTAQIAISGHYDESKTIASFVGFAPFDQPKFVMLVTLQEPSSSQWGSETAAPLFFAIAKDLFLYYNIPPSE